MAEADKQADLAGPGIGSYDELEKLLANAETVLRRLDIEYRVLLLAAGDQSWAAADG